MNQSRRRLCSHPSPTPLMVTKARYSKLHRNRTKTPSQHGSKLLPPRKHSTKRISTSALFQHHKTFKLDIFQSFIFYNDFSLHFHLLHHFLTKNNSKLLKVTRKLLNYVFSLYFSFLGFLKLVFWVFDVSRLYGLVKFVKLKRRFLSCKKSNKITENECRNLGSRVVYEDVDWPWVELAVSTRQGLVPSSRIDRLIVLYSRPYRLFHSPIFFQENLLSFCLHFFYLACNLSFSFSPLIATQKKSKNFLFNKFQF